MTVLNRLRAAPSFVRFGLVGGSGFALCAGVLQGLELLGLRPFLAQFPTFFVGVLFTWSLNRRFTFQRSHKSLVAEFGEYVAASSVGLAVNVGAFSLALAAGLPSFPALGAAALAGMLVNYFGYSRVVYSSRR